MKVLVLGSMTWSDQQKVRDYIQALAQRSPEAEVITDSDPYGAQSAAVRQCRCSGLVLASYQTPANASKRISGARVVRDQVMLRQLGPGDRIVVFGDLDPNRDHLVRTFVNGHPGIQLERIAE